MKKNNAEIVLPPMANTCTFLALWAIKKLTWYDRQERDKWKIYQKQSRNDFLFVIINHDKPSKCLLVTNLSFYKVASIFTIVRNWTSQPNREEKC